LRTLFSRLHNRESTAIVGSPHIGKSSVMRYIADADVKALWLEEIADQLVFVEIDCHLVPTSFTATDFWQFVLDGVENLIADTRIQRQVKAVRQQPLNGFSLQSLFSLLGRNDYAAVVLIDEFDALLNHPNFNTPDFFGGLRSLATRTDGLMLVTASRLSVGEMNRRSQVNNLYGSPFFNNIIEVQLPPLSPQEVELLLDRVLSGSGLTLSTDERAFIQRVAGRQPFLVQTAAASLFDAITQGTADEERFYLAHRTLYQRAAGHFEDIWRHLKPEQQTIMLSLALAEMRGYAERQAFNLAELGSPGWYDPQLQQLEESGLVEQVKNGTGGRRWDADWRTTASWQGSRWRVSSGCFVRWVFDNVNTDVGQTLDFPQWLQNRTSEGILTPQGKEKLQALSAQIPQALGEAAHFHELLTGAPTYQFFDLRLERMKNNQLRIEVASSPAGEAKATTRMPKSTLADLENNASTNLPALATTIGEALLPGDVRLCFEASLGYVRSSGDGLCLRLRIEDEQVAAVPWETARLGEEYLSLRSSTPIVRYVTAAQPPTPLQVQGALRLLGVISNPTDLAALDVAEEKHRLEAALRPLLDQGRVQLEWLPAANTQLLQDALRRQPHIVHFIGHGSHELEGGLLWFTNSQGKAEKVSATWLATLLKDRNVRFVFLNACETGRTAGGLAEILVRRSVPAALGMQTDVYDHVAIAFSSAFYRALSDGWPIMAALVEGRKAIVNALNNDPAQPQWAQPILYMRSPDGKLFD